MDFDNRMPAASDAIEDTLDYKAVSKRLIDFVGNRATDWWRPWPKAARISSGGIRRRPRAAEAEQARRGARRAAVGVIIERTRGD